MTEDVVISESPGQEMSCLHFPETLASALARLQQYSMVSLRDVFGPRLSMTDEQLLRSAVTPEECQLRMTAYLLRRQHVLQETQQENVEMKQLILGVAQECAPYQYKGRRS